MVDDISHQGNDGNIQIKHHQSVTDLQPSRSSRARGSSGHSCNIAWKRRPRSSSGDYTSRSLMPITVRSDAQMATRKTYDRCGYFFGITHVHRYRYRQHRSYRTLLSKRGEKRSRFRIRIYLMLTMQSLTARATPYSVIKLVYCTYIADIGMEGRVPLHHRQTQS